MAQKKKLAATDGFRLQLEFAYGRSSRGAVIYDAVETRSVVTDPISLEPPIDDALREAVQGAFSSIDDGQRRTNIQGGNWFLIGIEEKSKSRLSEFQVDAAYPNLPEGGFWDAVVKASSARHAEVIAMLKMELARTGESVTYRGRMLDAADAGNLDSLVENGTQNHIEEVTLRSRTKDFRQTQMISVLVRRLESGKAQSGDERILRAARKLIGVDAPKPGKSGVPK